MIEIKNVDKFFGTRKVFQNLNLSIKDGEFVAITGRSGSGKTTLLYMIGGLEAATSGQILIDGLDISKRSSKNRIFRDKVGYLFQNFALVDNKTVLENMNMIYKGSRCDVSVEEALERVGLLDKQNDKVYMLSGGEQQRVALARLMIKKCSIILADEPTASLDPENTERVMDIMGVFSEMGKTVVIVTHDMKIAEQCKRRIQI